MLVRRALTAGLDPQTPGALERFLAHYDERLTVHTRPYEGLVDALSALRSEGRALAVLTNKPGRPSREILERLELAPFFSQVIGGDTAAGRKPDPTGLLNIVQRAEAAPSATVMVGDSPVDAETAEAGRGAVHRLLRVRRTGRQLGRGPAKWPSTIRPSCRRPSDRSGQIAAAFGFGNFSIGY